MGLFGKMAGFNTNVLAADGSFDKFTGKQGAGHGPYRGEMVLDEHPPDEAVWVELDD